MSKDKYNLNNYIYGNCPLCKKGCYHRIKKPVAVLDSGTQLYVLENRLMVYKCTKCKKKWGMFV